MLKDASYKEKFSVLQPWMPLILETIKKELKNDHLKKDPGFLRVYFPGKNPAKLSTQDLAEGYIRAIAEGERSEQLAEFISNRWLLKNSEIYHYFEQELGRINPQFNEISELDVASSTKIMEGAVRQFGAIATYLFCVLNSVVFPEEIYKRLNSDASTCAEAEKQEELNNERDVSAESLQRRYEQQIARLTDKYEKKILGLEKKYQHDVEALKKQVAVLQRKLSSSPA